MPTQTLRPQVGGSGEEAIVLVKVRCICCGDDLLNKRVPVATSQTLPTFDACKRNAVHTSARKEQTLTNIFGTVSLQAGKEKESSSKAPQTIGHTAEIQRGLVAWALDGATGAAIFSTGPSRWAALLRHGRSRDRQPGQKVWQKWRSPTSTARYSVAYKFENLNLMSLDRR